MPPDPALADLLETMAGDSSFTRPTETDIAGARISHEADALRFTPREKRSSVADVSEVDLSNSHGKLRVRIYRPHTERTTLPTIVWYHGGGWTTGSLETGDILARALCHSAPAVVVSVAYRLAPEHRWPAAIEDAARALAWVTDNIDELGGNEASIAVGGDSAGGNVAAVIAQTGREAGPQLAAQILIYPFLDLDLQEARQRYPSLTENAAGYYVTLDDLRWCVGNYLPIGADLTDPRISPSLQPDLSGLPAAVIAVAEYDPLRDQGIVYADAVRGSSVPVTLHKGLGLIHGYCDMLGVVTAARFELERVIDSVSNTLAASVT